MAFPYDQIRWLLANKAKVRRYIVILQLVAGLFLVSLGYSIGKDHFHLIQKGARTQGKIVAYEQEIFKSARLSSTAFMPIVEFQFQGRTVRFKDWKGSPSEGGLQLPVVVLYDPADPSRAMVDRPVWNWIPWAPIAGLGLFLIFVALKGLLRLPAQRS